MSELNSQSGTKTYLRLLGYVGWYWAAFSLAVLGLLIHTGAEIAFIDLLGYITDMYNVTDYPLSIIPRHKSESLIDRHQFINLSQFTFKT